MELEKEMIKRWGKHVDFVRLKIYSRCDNFEEKLRLFADCIPNVSFSA